MALCDRCINKENCGVQEFFGEGKLLLSHCRNFVGEAPREIKTNFQRITSSPEALAEFIAWQLSQLNDIHECDIPIDVDDNLFKKEFWLKWLKQESE